MDELEVRIRQALYAARQALALGEIGTLGQQLEQLRSETQTAQYSDDDRRRLLEMCDAGLRRVAWASSRHQPAPH